MAKYTSNLPELSFYVGGERKKFVAGVFKTTDKKAIEVLDKLPGVKKEQDEKPKQQKKPVTRKKASEESAATNQVKPKEESSEE